MGLFAFVNRLSTRSELMETMFARLGVRGWFAEDLNGPATFRQAALRCVVCSESEACSDWLRAHETAEHAPGFCRNRDLIERIRRETDFVKTPA